MKRTISLLLTLLMLLSVFAGLSVTAFAEEAALTVYVQYGTREAQLVKSYSASALDALKETKADGYSYVFWKGETEKAVVATELVTLDALFSDAGTSFAAGDSLSFTCADGPYTKGDFTYETMSQRGYDTTNTAVPSGIAVCYGSSLDDQAANGSLRFVCGATAAELEGHSAAGSRMPSDVVAITIVKPEPTALEVYTKTGDAEPVLAKAYTLSDLDALKETKAEGYNYVFWKGETEKAVVATELVTLDALFSDAGASFAAGDSLSFTCADGPYTKGDFTYETMSQRGYDTTNTAVPSGIAVCYGSSLDDQAANGSLRFVCGATAAELEAKSAAGSRMPGGVIAVTVVKPEETPEPAIVFEDVAEGIFYHDAVYWAVEQGITYGTSATTFSPDKKCTRGEMVTFLWRAAGSPAPKATQTAFTDLKDGSFYYDAVLWAVEEGITAGTSATTFSPDATVSRGEAVTFLFRLAKAETPAQGNPFTDVPADAFYTDAVLWAYANHITAGTSATTFSPKAPCLRAQIVTFLYNFCK